MGFIQVIEPVMLRIADELALWGGVECTVNRVGNAFLDQSHVTAHDRRVSDLDLLLELGVTAVRYPVLWERVAPIDPSICDWLWTDERLRGLRVRNISVIAGLVHHGSGPAYTNLLSDNFASGVARHAAATASRYPWIADWTPVNEPCTTARFSCLYSHWYPHARDERSFWLALLNQIDATRLAMREIRRVNANARLIQTDDLGRTYATWMVRDQAAFDNTRRWMSWDLLCGKVTRTHSFWNRISDFGLGDRLRAIADDPCPPDIIGINHYLTSDRFLDHRTQRYPALSGSAPSGTAFVDTEAVRVLTPPPAGLEGALREAWDRYGVPLAVTEVHNGCTRDEQMRWMRDAWETAGRLRRQGIAVEAVTAWALFGNSGWNTLLTQKGNYEPGAYDVRTPVPRATAMVPLLQSLSRGVDPAHPVLGRSGWWRRNMRLQHPRISRPASMWEQRRDDEANVPRVLICGATGTLGRALAAACRHRNIVHLVTSRKDLDLGNAASIDAALDTIQPWLLINAAGWVRVDEAEEQPEACRRANASGAVQLAKACAARGIATVSFSSDLVFDGSERRPYRETDIASPLNVYGRSKSEAEQGIAALQGCHLIVRTAAFFSPYDEHNFAAQVAGTLAAGRKFTVLHDQVISPTYLPDLCNAVLDLAIDGQTGIWHLTNGTALTWTDFAHKVANRCDLDGALIEPDFAAGLAARAPRPTYAALISERGMILPDLADALDRFRSAWLDLRAPKATLLARASA
jgi:dTDP-4-dehydrorhamnose reductase